MQYQRFIVFGALGLAAAIAVIGLAAHRVTQPERQEQAIASTPTPSPSPSPTESPSPAPTPSATPYNAPTPVQPRSTPQAVMPVLPVATVLPGVAANVRSAPSIHAAIKGVAMPGQQVQIKPSVRVEQNGVTWVSVIVGEQEGWIASGLLTKVRSPLPVREYAPQPQSVIPTINL